MGESRTPVTISFVTVLANAALNFALVQVMGYRGLALGTSIAALLNAGLLLVMLRRRLGGIDGGAIASALAADCGGGGADGRWPRPAPTRSLPTRIPGNGLVAQLVRVGTTIGVALAVLAVSAHVLRVPQFCRRRLADHQAPPPPLSGQGGPGGWAAASRRCGG